MRLRSVELAHLFRWENGPNQTSPSKRQFFPVFREKREKTTPRYTPKRPNDVRESTLLIGSSYPSSTTTWTSIGLPCPKTGKDCHILTDNGTSRPKSVFTWLSLTCIFSRTHTFIFLFSIRNVDRIIFPTGVDLAVQRLRWGDMICAPNRCQLM